MAREINLVPSSKFEAIKAIKIRNLILFLCIAVSGGAIAVVFVLGTILGGQGIILGDKDNMLDLYSKKINSYSELSDFLTIKDQLGKLRILADHKNLLTRTFNLLPVLVPTNGDEVNFSKLTLSFDEGVILGVEAQANANSEPYIDYNVLDAFKKAMDYYRYDYGTYVNELGDIIPSYCIVEKDPATGSMFKDEQGGYYAYWTVKVDGCDPRHPIDLLAEEDDEEEADEEAEEEMQYDLDFYNGQDVVKIWRTPQFKDWYAQEYMTLDGVISGVPHFESNCTSYSGQLDESTDEPYFEETNGECYLIEEGKDGFFIETSSNARSQDDDDLVLTFKGAININPEFYRLQNTHMMAVAPNKRYNVTDSYVQVQSLFVPPAVKCDIGDTACKNGEE